MRFSALIALVLPLCASAGELKVASLHPLIGDLAKQVGGDRVEVIDLIGKNGDPHQPDADLTKRMVAEAQKRGLILLSCGVYANVIRVLVPLVAEVAAGPNWRDLEDVTPS